MVTGKGFLLLTKTLFFEILIMLILFLPMHFEVSKMDVDKWKLE